MRVGFGFDVHPFLSDETEDEDWKKPLILGGIIFEGEHGLKGHSDADVVSHACADALLSAAGLEDIGQLFPDTDPQYKDADSLKLLQQAAKMVRDEGFKISNISCVVIANRPKIAPQKEAIEKNLSEIVDAPVTVSGKRNEGAGPGGHENDKTITCMATALLSGTGK